MTWFTNHYLNTAEDKQNPLASPLLAADLPYAVVRRHAHHDAIPEWLESDVAAAARLQAAR